MKYKLRKNFTKDPENAIYEILTDRGVEDLQNFIHPSEECELDPHNLNNVEIAADKLLFHLRKNSSILLIVD